MKNGGDLRAGTAPAGPPGKSLGEAWLALTCVLAIHIVDEADHDFLSVYNPIAASVRQRLPYLPVPTFTFGVWLTELVLAVVLLLVLSPLVYRGGRWMRRCAYVFAGMMAANGMVHCAGSLHWLRVLPGTWSAPLLLIAAAWLFVAARRATPGHHPPVTG